MGRMIERCARVLVVAGLMLAIPSVAPAVAAPSATPIGWAPGAYVPLQTIRLLDTATGIGTRKGVVAARSAIALQVSGRGSVPATGVGAVVLNVTARAGTAAGSVAVYPHAGRRPSLGQVRYGVTAPTAGLVTVQVGASGQVDFYNSSTGVAHLVADVVGYYVAGTPASTGMFRPTDPVRLLDTRIGFGSPYAAQVPVAPRASFDVEVAGRPPVPVNGVAGAVLQVTMVSATAPGSLVLFPSGAPQPTGISAKFPTLAAITTHVTVRLGTYGRVALANQSLAKVHVIVDLVGWYVTPAIGVAVMSASVTGSTTAVGPSVVYRSSVAAPEVAGATRAVKILGRGGVPATGVSAVHVSLTVLAASKAGALAAYATGPRAPSASNMFFPVGGGTTNAAIVPVGADGSITIANRAPGATQVMVVVDGYVLQRPVSLRTVAQPSAGLDPLQHLSCVSSTFCMSMDRFGAAMRFDGAVWSAPQQVMDAEVRALSCVESGFCLAVADNEYATFSGGRWSSTIGRLFSLAIIDVSCVSATYCVALTSGGATAIFDGVHWAAAPVAFATATAIDCVTTSWCIAVGGQGVYAVRTGSTWGAPSSPDGSLFASSVRLSCGDVNECMVVGASGAWTFAGTAWQAVFLFPSRTFSSVSCAGTRCVTMSNLDASTFDSGAWVSSVALAEHVDGVVSCASASWCMAIGKGGWAASFVDGAWGTPAAVHLDGAIAGISCPNPSWCVAVTPNAAMRFDGSTWTAPAPLPPLPPTNQVGYTDVSCSSPSFCLAVGDNGGSAQWDGATWSPHAESGYGAYRSVSCPVDGFCVATTGGFNSILDHGTWLRSTLGGNYGSDAVDCTTTIRCIVVTATGGSFRFDGSTWSPLPAVGFEASRIECIGDQWCLATGRDRMLDAGRSAVFDGTSWSVLPMAMKASSLSCTSPVACVAIDDSGAVATFDGSSWTQQPSMVGPFNFVIERYRVECVSTAKCLVSGG